MTFRRGLAQAGLVLTSIPPDRGSAFHKEPIDPAGVLGDHLI